jgi:hypothetical protein
MKSPQGVGAAITMERMRIWMDDFSGYRVTITEHRIQRWLEQFQEGHRDLAARLLDVVDFVGNDQISKAFRAALQSLDGWSSDANQRLGRWFFVPFSASAGESGDHMLNLFRTANNLGGRGYNDLFRYRSELLELAPSDGDTVVFVDDFAGTGEQACDAWNQIYRELLPFGPRIILVLVASSTYAIQRIRQETELAPHAHFELGVADNVFADSCGAFSRHEKEAILKYCQIADPKRPRGFGDCGFVIVFAHKCPNNTIPILHVRRGEWEGLFRRHS